MPKPLAPTYSAPLPPFLARLQASTGNRGEPRRGDGDDTDEGEEREHGDGDHDPHRSRVQAAGNRPKRARRPSEIEEDEPVVLDEASGEAVSMGVWKERQARRADGAGGVDEGGREAGRDVAVDDENVDAAEGGGGSSRRAEEKVVEVGGAGGKRKKMGKVIGGDEDQEDSAVVEVGAERAARDPASLSGLRNEANRTGTKVKKAKKIKLSFGDD